MIQRILITALILIFPFLARAEYILLGVVEETNQAPDSIAARVLFSKMNNKWQILNTEQSQDKLDISKVTWTLAFDGKSLGKITTINNYELKYPDCTWCFHRDKYFRVEDKSKFPKLGNKEKRFSDWSYQPSTRPIVIVNKPFYKDHEKWKRYRPNLDVLKVLFPILKEKIGQAYHCEGPPKWDAKEIDLKINDVKFFRSYRNNKGQMLVSAGIIEEHIKNCDGPTDKTQEPMWFFISSDTKFVGFELDLLDAADYDNDGDIEFIFSHSGYNRDGYTLYESDFNERYDYYWSYH